MGWARKIVRRREQNTQGESFCLELHGKRLFGRPKRRWDFRNFGFHNERVGVFLDQVDNYGLLKEHRER
jgi:hypothetical protein